MNLFTRRKIFLGISSSILITTYFILYHYLNRNNCEQLTEFSVGVIGTLAAFISLVFLVLDQRDKEIETNTEQFRIGFSQIFNLYLESKNDLIIKERGKTGKIKYRGRECFEFFQLDLDKIGFKEFSKNMNSSLDIYLNSLRHIRKWLTPPTLCKQMLRREEESYFGISSQMGETELAFLTKLKYTDKNIDWVVKAIRKERLALD